MIIESREDEKPRSGRKGIQSDEIKSINQDKEKRMCRKDAPSFPPPPPLPTQLQDLEKPSISEGIRLPILSTTRQDRQNHVERRKSVEMSHCESSDMTRTSSVTYLVQIGEFGDGFALSYSVPFRLHSYRPHRSSYFTRHTSRSSSEVDVDRVIQGIRFVMDVA